VEKSGIYAKNRHFSHLKALTPIEERGLMSGRPKVEKALWRKNDNVDILVDLLGTFGDVGANR
jgi:hypothetical protein